MTNIVFEVAMMRHFLPLITQLTLIRSYVIILSKTKYRSKREREIELHVCA